MSTTIQTPEDSLQSSEFESETRPEIAMGKETSVWIYLWSIVAIASVPFLVPYGLTLWRQDLYQYFPFVYLGVGYLFYQRWNRFLNGPRGLIGWSLLTGGLLILLLGAIIHSTWLGNLAFVLMATSFLSAQRSIKGEYLTYLALPLLMLIRLPQLHATSLVVRLQKITSSLSHLALDLMSVPHDAFANRLILPEKELFVAEACSGIQSAFTMCFLALLIIVWQRRPLVLTPIYIVFALVFAVLANTIRVTLIAIAQAWYGLDWTEGFVHDAVGYFSLAIAAGTLWSFDKLCALLFHQVNAPSSNRGLNPLAAGWNWVLGYKMTTYGDTGYSWLKPDEEEEERESQRRVMANRESESKLWPAYLASGVAGLAGVIMLAGFAFGRSDQRPIISKEALLFDPPQNLLGDRVGVLAIGGHEIVRNGSDSRLGIHADLWACGFPQGSGQIVMSQPYVGWHELCVCYEVLEWKLERRYNLAVPEGKPIAVGEFSKPDENLRGYLFFSAIDTDGSIPTPPSYTPFGRLVAPFYPLVTDDFAETSGSAQTIMLQMWTVSPREFASEEITEIAKSFADVRNTARTNIVTQQDSLLSNK